MSNYTLGPCEIIDVYEADLLNEARPRREEVWEIGNREAGRTSGYATNRADAVLFVAAPELLEELVSCLAYVQRYYRTLPDDGAEQDFIMSSVIEPARKAIAKAKGETYED